MNDYTELTAYADASFDQRRSIAGWGVVIQIKKKGVVKEHPYRNYLSCTSNNYAELYAIHQALILLAGNKYRNYKTPMTIYTDSQTALDYINGLRDKDYELTHMARWNKSQWLEHKKMQYLAYKIRKMVPEGTCSFRKVKGHVKDYKDEHLNNNLADGYAKIGRSLYYMNKKARN